MKQRTRPQRSSDSSARQKARAMGQWLWDHRPDKPALVIVGLYVLFIIVITFPYVVHPATTMIGPMGGDVSASVAKYEAIELQGANPFTTERWTEISAPGGIQANLGVDRVSLLSVLFLWWGSLTVGPIAIHTLESILGYLLTAIIAFWFVRRVTGSLAGGAVAGLVFGFSPHMLSIARAAPTYTHMWLLLLPLIAFWWLVKKGPNFPRAVLAGASVLPAMFWTPYYLLHALVVAASCLVVALVWWAKSKFGFRRLALWATAIVTIWALALGVFWYIGTHSPSTQVPQRTLEEAYGQAAHPLMYVLPGNFSVWGKHLNTWLSETVPQAPSTNLYVGFTTLLLGATAIYFVSKKRVRRPKQTQAMVDRQTGIKIATWMALASVVCCFFFSLPPKVHIGSVVLPTPNELVIQTVPALRAGQRLVMPLMGVLAVLAGIGTYALLQYFRPRARWVIGTLVVAVVLLDIWALPPLSATNIPISPALTALSQQPRGLTAHYLSSSLVGGPGQLPCVLQWQHRQPIVNDCVLGRPDNNPNQTPPHLSAIVYMPLCDQMRQLRDVLSVRYIIVRTQGYAVQRCFDSPKLIGSDKEYVVIELSGAKIRGD